MCPHQKDKRIWGTAICSYKKTNRVCFCASCEFASWSPGLRRRYPEILFSSQLSGRPSHGTFRIRLSTAALVSCTVPDKRVFGAAAAHDFTSASYFIRICSSNFGSHFVLNSEHFSQNSLWYELLSF